MKLKSEDLKRPPAKDCGPADIFKNELCQTSLSAQMKSELHIVIACPACGGSGSVAGVAIHHALELAKYFRVTLISDSFPDIGPAGAKLQKVTPRRFDYLRRFCHVPNEYAFAKSVRDSMRKIHKEDPIDMVICHGHALATLSAGPLKKKYGTPYALVTHGDIFDRPEGTYDKRLTAFYRTVTPPAYRNADLILALSPYMASCAIKGGASPHSIKVVPNGIDPADIGLEHNEATVIDKARIHSGPLKLLFVGRLSVEKGVDVLIRACEALDSRGVDFTLDIIGAGPLEKTVQEIVSAANLDDKIAFLGKIGRRSLGNYYRRSDLVCVPSLSDPLPTVVLESLLSGVPVLGSNVGGIPYMVETGKNGIIVSHIDVSSLAEAIEKLSQNRDQLSFLAGNAHASVYTRFHWEDIGRAISCAVKECLALNGLGLKKN